MTLTIASVNVNGIRAAVKQRNERNPGMLSWLQSADVDVVCMQEVRATEEQATKALEPALEDGWHLIVAPAATKGRAGVGILARQGRDDLGDGTARMGVVGRRRVPGFGVAQHDGLAAR